MDYLREGDFSNLTWSTPTYKTFTSLASGNMRNQSGDLRGISDTDSETSVTICKNGSNETLSVEQLETGLMPYVSLHSFT